MSKNKKIRKTLSLDKNLIEAAERICSTEQRTLSNFVNVLLEKFVKRQSAKK